MNNPFRGRRSNGLSLGQMRDLGVGLFGVQVVWGLQNVNTSRIFQNLGADIGDLPLLWIAAPITGLLVQPLVGYFSDRLGGRWGRRRPFMVAGGILTALSLLTMGNASSLGLAIAALWMLTASVNLLMHPMRSIAADQLPPEQRALGFSMQVLFIGAGAVFASVLPWVLVNYFGVSGEMRDNALPRSVELAFEIGAGVVLLAVGWTFLRGADFPLTDIPKADLPEAPLTNPQGKSATLLSIAGAVVIAVAAIALPLQREAFLLALALALFGVFRLLKSRTSSLPGIGRALAIIADDLAQMPSAMRNLGVTQFFTWLALFTLWVYSIPAIALRHFGTSDASSSAFGESADWAGVLAAIYDGTAAVVALAFPLLARLLGTRLSHAASLLIGAAGILGLLMVDAASMLWLPAICIGIAWTSILAVPYIVVAGAAPPDKVGVYMGIHNIFLVLPQLFGAAALGLVLDHLLDGRPDGMMLVSAASMTVAALTCIRLPADRTLGETEQLA